MTYLKLKNTPLRFLSSAKYGSVKNDIPWDACGFNKLTVSMTALQYRDADDNFIQILQVSDIDKLNTKFDFMLEDVSAMPDSCEISLIDAAEYEVQKTLRDEWKAANAT